MNSPFKQRAPCLRALEFRRSLHNFNQLHSRFVLTGRSRLPDFLQLTEDLKAIDVKRVRERFVRDTEDKLVFKFAHECYNFMLYFQLDHVAKMAHSFLSERELDQLLDIMDEMDHLLLCRRQ
mmetsp:Transcript_19018/g.26528  ORF Transcript_19018/g.26528 Transcript_19018/m.26528 type:complete len:122 (-) Transcript_19018:231-596(-)